MLDRVRRRDLQFHFRALTRHPQKTANDLRAFQLHDLHVRQLLRLLRLQQ